MVFVEKRLSRLVKESKSGNRKLLTSMLSDTYYLIVTNINGFMGESMNIIH